MGVPTGEQTGRLTGGHPLTRRRFVELFAGATVAGAAAPLLAGCADGDAARRLVTDMGGRAVEIPQNVGRVLCTNPIGTVDVYLLDPTLLVGWNFKPQAADAAFLDATALELPSLGVWMGAGSVPNAEEVLAARPDVLLCFWSTDEAGVRMADSIAAEMRLPVLLCDCNIERVVETYGFLGEVFGEPLQERIATLSSYFAEKLDLIRSTVAHIPADELRSVFLSEGKGGLQTDPVGSLHVQDALNLLRTRNVVDLPGSEGQGMGMPNVSIEQIITWDPSAILVSEYSMSDTAKSDLYHEIRADANWNMVPAVAAGEVYQIPQSPFSWFGRPPSAVRVLGCLWLLCRLYPAQAEAAGIELEAEVREFFSLCLARDLTEAESAALLKQ
jgi:iron complex transport system substrate-binding protein